MKDFYTSKDFGEVWNIHHTAAKKWLDKNGFEYTEKNGRGGMQHIYTPEQFKEACELRQQEFVQGVSNGTSEYGRFYIIQLLPEIYPQRIKLGFADSLKARLANHRTVAPTAQVLISYPAKRSWEKAVIDYLTQNGCQLVGGEVFDFNDIEALLGSANEFFTMMPKIEVQRDTKTLTS